LLNEHAVCRSGDANSDNLIGYWQKKEICPMTIGLIKYSFLWLVAVLVLGATDLRAQVSDQELLNTRIEQFEVKEQSINLVLAKIAYDYGVPIGLVMGPEKEKPVRKSITISLQDGRLKELLNAVTEQDSRYEWKVVEGVINVSPKVNRDPFLEDLLVTRIQHFYLDQDSNRYRLRNDIMDLGEIKVKLDREGVTPMVIAVTGVDFTKLGAKSSLSLTDVTLREILNQIIRKSETKYWVLNRYGPRHESITLNF
jgi:hypothetical protein